ncbi:hypothetical protein ETD83_17560 [Actinomadura soli]|uniref:Uncharacterized protein n=1 Tax=Actinomadura soli TaxID=2508997 RepID=A0A5C4JCR6_9ACTN|nr:hypothetical protein [Actinomadura soli]TMR00145.1 hypothetical protein ETD83_17560 [Actinomadura soli]
MTISESAARLRNAHPGWEIDYVGNRAVPWLAIREHSAEWIGGHPAAEATLPGTLERLINQAVALAALASDVPNMPRAERMENLKTLRANFPGWAFDLSNTRPYWRAQRDYLYYADRPATITELRGNDPNEMALLLLRIPKAEAGLDDGQ